MVVVAETATVEAVVAMVAETAVEVVVTPQTP
jgi:hypothetical protein